MREIIFRGLRTDGEGWVYGSLVNNGFFNSETKQSVPYIFNTEECDNAYGWEDFDDDYGYYQVIPESVGQYTGLKDRNGNDIYDGDKFGGGGTGEYYLIEWNDEDAKFQVNLYGYNMYLNEGGGEEYDNETSCVDTDCFELSALTEDEIIGNIHEQQGGSD